MGKNSLETIQALNLQKQTHQSRLASGFAIAVLVLLFIGLDMLVISMTDSILWGASVWIIFGIMFLCGIISATKLGDFLKKQENMIPIEESHGNLAIKFRSAFTTVAKKAGLNSQEYQLYIVEDDTYNAFAAGAGKNRIVAAHASLLRDFSSHEVEGVLAHELGHQTNNDIFMLILANAMILSFVMFGKWCFEVGKVLLFTGSSRSSSKDKKPLTAGCFYLLGTVTFLIGYLFAPIAIAFLSRKREEMADANAVLLGFGEGLQKALIKLQGQEKKTTPIKKAMASLYISQVNMGFLGRVFADHPPLEKRAKRIQKLLEGDQGLIPDVLEHRMKTLLIWLLIPAACMAGLFFFGNGELPGMFHIPFAFVATVVWLWEMDLLLQVNTQVTKQPEYTKKTWFKIVAATMLILGIAVGFAAIMLTGKIPELVGFTGIMYGIWGSKPMLAIFSKFQFMKFVGDIATYTCIVYALVSLGVMIAPMIKHVI